MDSNANSLQQTLNQIQGSIAAMQSSNAVMHTEMQQLRIEMQQLRTQMADFRTEITGQMADFRTENTDFRTEITGQMADFRTEITGQMADFRTEITGQMADFRTEITGQMADFRTEITEQMADFRTEITEQMADFRTEITGQVTSVRTELRQLTTVIMDGGRANAEICTAMRGELSHHTRICDQRWTETNDRIQNVSAAAITRIIENNSAARFRNMYPSWDLDTRVRPMISHITSGPIPFFPATYRDLSRLSRDQCAEILRHLGQPVAGNVSVLRKQVRGLLGYNNIEDDDSV